MTDIKLKNIVAEAVALDREIQEQTEHLRVLKKLLIVEGESRFDELVETEGGGASVVFEGADGCIARVTFPAPSLKSKIDGEGKAIEKIKDLAGPSLNRLFLPAVSYKPIPDFRGQAVVLLGKSDGGRLIHLCEGESSPKVSFETKEVA